MQLENLFSVPLIRASAVGFEGINQSLGRTFERLAIDSDSFVNKNSSMRIQPGVVESNFGLFGWSFGEISQLSRFCTSALWKAVVLINQFNDSDLKNLEMKIDSWFHVTRTGGFHAMHNHPMASWSGVYCVDPGDDVPGNIDSGLLSFHNPLAAGNMFLDATNNRTPAPFGLSGKAIKFQAGDLVIFPSWLWHQAMPYFGTRSRITVAFNAWFEARQKVT